MYKNLQRRIWAVAKGEIKKSIGEDLEIRDSRTKTKVQEGLKQSESEKGVKV